jgi:dethiobiotin synthetase
MKYKPIFVTGIGTGVGKTIVSAILVEKLQADYWKPIQSGDLHYSDTDTIKRLISNPISKLHPEAYRLRQPFSPHQSAHLDGIRIEMDQITLPTTKNTLVIEGAGGILVPLNEKDLMADLIQHLEAEVILVISHYLGSINHSLLSIELLLQRNIPIKGLIINGNSNSYSEDILLNYKNMQLLGRVQQHTELSPQVIKEAQQHIKHLEPNQ